MLINTNQEILNICNYEYDFFLNKANVVGVGLGFKIRKGIITSERVIQVFVCKKVASNLLNSNYVIPSCYKNIKTYVTESGVFTATLLNTRVRPVIGG